MKGFLRRLRGIIGTGLVWAFGWAGFFGALSLTVLVVRIATGFDPQGVLLPLLQAAFKVGTYGFLAGSTFGVVLSILERHKSLEEITFRRIALWGSLGGLAVITLTTLLYGIDVLTQLYPVIFYTLLGIGSATGTVALAKRGENRFIEGGDDLPALEGE